MKPMRLFSLGTAALLLSGVSATAQTFSFNFDSVASGTFASSFNTPAFSFHNATYIASVDEFGDPIPGSEHWQIDTVSDTDFPVTVDTITDWETSAAYTDGNALNAQWQSVIVLFDQAYNLTDFSVTLDSDTFGFTQTIDFLSGESISDQVSIDQSVPGFIATLNSAGSITGFVLPSSGYYDNLTFTISAVPEPSTWPLLAGVASLAFVTTRRGRRQS